MTERIYLDSNIIVSWFKRKMKSIKENKEFEIPKRVQIVFKQKKYTPIVSTLVRAEVFRYLKSEWNAKEKETEERWIEFLSAFNIVEWEIENFNINLSEIKDICKMTPLGKRGIIDIFHIQIARSENLILLTGDKKLRERLNWYYSKIINFDEFYEDFLSYS